MGEALRDIKPPVFFSESYVLLAVIGGVILALLIFLIILFLKRRAGEKINYPIIPPKPAEQIAYEALKALKAENLPLRGKIKAYYFKLSDIVRHYLEDRFFFRAPEMTTEEFLYTLRQSEKLEEKHKILLKEFLTHSDLVKFAKYGPNPKEIDQSFTSASKLIDETKNI